MSIEVILDNKKWQGLLQERGEALKNCQFPADRQIKIYGTRELVTVEMSLAGIAGNMQSDAAAFEAWTLALLVHCGVNTVNFRLKDDVAIPAAGDKEYRHFQRFLYRMHRFQELFAEIEIDPALRGGGAALKLGADRKLNQPSPVSNRGMSGAFLDNFFGASESDLEKAIERSPAFRRRFDLKKVMRQWPIGLFDQKVAKRNYIFTGGKSAIDLIGVRGDTLYLFELKKRGNRKAGAISELFFYASVMRDALEEEALFKFEPQHPTTNFSISAVDIRKCRSIVAVLLAPDFHPLISEHKIIARLNKASAEQWLNKPVRFEAIQLRLPEQGGDFSFSSAH